jgi:hypothetical protein
MQFDGDGKVELVWLKRYEIGGHLEQGHALPAGRVELQPGRIGFPCGVEESEHLAFGVEQDMHVHGSLLERVHLRRQHLDTGHHGRPRLALPAQGH